MLGLRIKRSARKRKITRADFKVQLRRRGYCAKLIKAQLQKVDRLERSELLQYNAKKDKNAYPVPLIVTFSNLLPDVHGIIRTHGRVVQV